MDARLPGFEFPISILWRCAFRFRSISYFGHGFRILRGVEVVQCMSFSMPSGAVANTKQAHMAHTRHAYAHMDHTCNSKLSSPTHTSWFRRTSTTHAMPLGRWSALAHGKLMASLHAPPLGAATGRLSSSQAQPNESSLPGPRARHSFQESRAGRGAPSRRAQMPRRAASMPPSLSTSTYTSETGSAA